MYEFVRFNYKGTHDNDEKHWWFVAKTPEDVLEHTNKVFKPMMQEGFDSYAIKYIEAVTKCRKLKGLNGEDYIYIPHASNSVESVTRAIWSAKNHETNHNPLPLEFYNLTNDLYIEAFNNRIKDVVKHHIYLEDGVRQFGYIEGNPNFEIVERVTKDVFEYPDVEKYTFDNVKFIQWPGGTHWYAKIGRDDIVDEDGNQKWYTRKEAEVAARNYIWKNYR